MSTLAYLSSSIMQPVGNHVYCRFDSQNFLDENTTVQLKKNKIEEFDNSLTVHVNVNEVGDVFAHSNVKKASGPDGIPNKVLDLCNQQLASIFSCSLIVFLIVEWFLRAGKCLVSPL